VSVVFGKKPTLPICTSVEKKELPNSSLLPVRLLERPSQTHYVDRRLWAFAAAINPLVILAIHLT
jgi:hypothetical protein